MFYDMKITGPTTLQIRRLNAEEWPVAFPLLTQWRQLDRATFLQRVALQSRRGYQLVGAFRDQRLIALLGMRPVHTLARGPHLHVDDLIVDQHCRRSGAGQALMAFAEQYARENGMGALFLDARPDAIPFYQQQGFALHAAPSMRKPL